MEEISQKKLYKNNCAWWVTQKNIHRGTNGAQYKKTQIRKWKLQNDKYRVAEKREKERKKCIKRKKKKWKANMKSHRPEYMKWATIIKKYRQKKE